MKRVWILLINNYSHPMHHNIHNQGREEYTRRVNGLQNTLEEVNKNVDSINFKKDLITKVTKTSKFINQ